MRSTGESKRGESGGRDKVSCSRVFEIPHRQAGDFGVHVLARVSADVAKVWVLHP